MLAKPGALHFPNQIIHVSLVIPINAKWLGWANAARIAAFVLGGGAIFTKSFFAIAGLGAYLAVFVPALLAGAKQHRATSAPTVVSYASAACQAKATADIEGRANKPPSPLSP